MDNPKMREIERLINSTDIRDENMLRQAVRDSHSCVESRGYTGLCDCFCCSLVKELKERGYEVHKIAQSSGRLK